MAEKTYTYTLSEKPINMTVFRNVTLKDGENAEKYIDTVTYQVDCTDGTHTAVTSVIAGPAITDSEGNPLSVAKPSDKEKADFVEFDDLTECPPALYEKIVLAFNDSQMREILKKNVIAEYTNIVYETPSW